MDSKPPPLVQVIVLGATLVGLGVLLWLWGGQDSQAAEPADVELRVVGSSRVDLQACKLEYSIVSPK